MGELLRKWIRAAFFPIHETVIEQALHLAGGAAIAAVPILLSPKPLLTGSAAAAVAGLLREIEAFFKSDKEDFWMRLNLIDRMLDVIFFGLGAPALCGSLWLVDRFA